MSSVVAVTAKLDQMAAELDDLSKKLTLVERKLEPVEQVVTEYEDDYEAAWWERQKAGEKLPPQPIREALCRTSMPEKLRGEHAALLASRKRLMQRIKHIGEGVDAQRSILSALKAEMEAVS
jgi:predicted  nucleic acid-binding Zn-ribbon protein